MADSFWFFLSYARLELDVHIKRFREDLAALLRSRAGIEEPRNDRIGFLDIDGIEHGDDWPQELASALHLSRVLVPLYSPLYFKREFCGREFQVFRHPELAYRLLNPARHRRPILPVLLYPLADLPDNPDVRDLQVHDDRYPRSYRENGLHFIMDTPGYEADYKSFCWAFADRLRELALGVRPPAETDAAQLRPLRDVPAAFPARPPAAEPPTVAGDLKITRFVCAAARRGEVARQVDSYGAHGGIDWKPFAPSDMDVIGVIAQEAALRERFLSDSCQLDGNFRAHAEYAAAREAVLMVLVDPWTMTVPRYRQHMSGCDEMRPFCAIVVVWNGSDKETAARRIELNTAVRMALPNMAVAIRHPVFFRDEADTRTRLQADIQSTLVEIYMRTLQAKAAQLGATSDPPPSISNTREPGGGNA